MEEFETLTLDEKMLIFLMRKENINPASVFVGLFVMFKRLLLYYNNCNNNHYYCYWF